MATQSLIPIEMRFSRESPKDCIGSVMLWCGRGGVKYLPCHRGVQPMQ